MVNLAVIVCIIGVGFFYANIENWSQAHGGFFPFGFRGVSFIGWWCTVVYVALIPEPPKGRIGKCPGARQFFGSARVFKILQSWPYFVFPLLNWHSLGPEIFVGAPDWYTYLRGMILWDDTMGWYYGMILWDDTMGWYYGMILWDDTMGWYYGMILWDDTMGWYYGMILSSTTWWCA